MNSLSSQWWQIQKNLNFFRFKLESKDKKISAACCLRSKLYAIKYLNDSELIKLKGR